MSEPGNRRQCDEFDLQIRPLDDGLYEAAVLRSPAGETRHRFAFPLSATLSTSQMAQVEAAISGRAPVKDDAARFLGSRLFTAVFAAGVLQAYDQSLSLAVSRGRCLRVRLRMLDDPQLAALPWELLYDERRQRYVALLSDVVLVRTLETLKLVREATAAPPLRVLAMFAQPSDLDAIEVLHEQQLLARELARLGDSAELHWVAGQSWRDLQAALQRGPWHIFHFLGHGIFDPQRDAGYLAFVDEQGTADLRTAEEIARLLGDHADLRLVVLNACAGAQGGVSRMDAGITQQLVRAGAPAVLGIQYAIADPYALELTRSFYGALSSGLPIDAAFVEARKALSLAAPAQLVWAAPVLVMRSGEEPHTGSQTPPHRLPIPTGLAWLLLLIFTLATVLMAWSAWPQLMRTVGPVKMPNGYFNVAVAPFYAPPQSTFGGDEATRQQAIDRANGLAVALASNPEDFTQLFEVKMNAWGPNERIAAVSDATAHAYLDEIGANLLIYGEVELHDGRWRLTPKFVFDDPYTVLTAELAGNYVFGSAIEYEDSISGINQVTRLLRSRALSFSGIALGYSYLKTELAQGIERAAAILEWVSANSAWAADSAHDRQGQETIFLLLGLTYLQLASTSAPIDPRGAATYFDKAEAAIAAGLAINPTYARLLVAKANLRYQRLAAVADPPCTGDWIAQANAIDAAYQDALANLATDPLIADNLTQVWVNMFGQLGVGRVNLWRFRCTQASSRFAQKALQAYDKTIALYRDLETSTPDTAIRFAEPAIYAYAESAWLLLIADAVRSWQGQSYPDLERVAARVAEGDRLIAQTGSKEIEAYFHTFQTAACARAKQIHNPAVALPEKLNDICQ